MNREQKTQVISILADKFANSPVFYLTDSSTLTVEQVNKLRRICFEKNVEFKVVKNNLARLAMERHAEEKGFEPLYEALKGPTAVMFSDTGNLPAKIIAEFRKDYDRPLLKAAYVESAIYFGDDQLDTLKSIKSREELIGDIIALLQSPVKNVLGALQSGGHTITGLLKALEERS